MAEWSDGRLDEFAQRVYDRFDRVDRRFDRVDHEFARINDRLDDLVKVMIAGIIALTGAVLAGFAALVVLFVTQI